VNGLYLSMRELDALHGCGPLGMAAYVWLRSWVDLRSGRVGASRPISLQMLIAYTETHVPRGAGTQTIKPSVKEVRVVLDRLVRAGLLVRVGSDDALVFRMPMAVLPSHAQIKQGTVRAGCDGTEQGTEHGAEQGTEPGTLNASTRAGYECIHGTEQGTEYGTEHGTEYGMGKTPIQGTHQRSELKPSTPQAASTAEPGLEPGAGITDAIAAFWSAKKVGSDQPDEQVSRRATAMAVLLRTENVPATAMNPTLIGWAEQGIRDDQLQAAVVLARQRREAEGSLQPVNVGYLNACLQSVLRPPKPKSDPWWLSAGAMEAKARELGIAGARPGEETDAFKARITDAVRRQQGGVAE
jgi:hypothetical protein